MGVAQAAADAGVKFRFITEATGVLVHGYRARGIRLSAEGSRVDLATNTVVIAAGINSHDLAAPFGIRLPIYPVKGYSVTSRTARPYPATRCRMPPAKLR
jgi:D-amino-acid dehydrogenase